jgi:L-lactate dehydrogenase complex protein LldG
MSARAVILDRVRRARLTGYVPAPNAERAAPLAEDAGISPAQLLEWFLRELTLLGVEHHIEETPEAVRARVLDVVGSRRVLRWDADRLPYDVGSVLPGAATGESPRDVQAAAEIGVTGCEAALAETGTLAMLSGRGKPRSASLLPAVHVCVVRRSDLCGTMGQFFADRDRAIADAACCYFITGPSRTADIELTLTLGVHGPGHVVVVIGP